jgi:hypothetical protein
LRWAVTRARAAGGSCWGEGGVLIGALAGGTGNGEGARTAIFRSLRSARIWAICRRGGGFVVAICEVVWFWIGVAARSRCRASCLGDAADDVSVREIVAEGFLSSFPPANGCSVTQLIFYYVITARICYNDFYEKAGKGCVHWAQFRVRQSSVLELLSLGLGMKS